MLVMRFRALAGVAALAVNIGLGGCATLDAAAVAETHRLEEGEFYRDAGPGARPAVATVVLLPATLDPELSNVLGYDRREGEFAPLLAAVDADLAARACCRFLPGPALPRGRLRAMWGALRAKKLRYLCALWAVGQPAGWWGRQRNSQCS